MLFHVFVILKLASYSGQECIETATPLDRMNTRSVNYTATTSGTDNHLFQGWYSAMYNGSQYLIADSNHRPASTNSCGTVFPIYMAGVHPSLEPITEEPIDALICTLVRSNGSCSSYRFIKIRKCNGQIQYFLNPAWSPTLDFSGYCFDLSENILTANNVEQLCSETAKPLDRMDTRSVNYTSTTNSTDTYLQEGWYSTTVNCMQYLIADSNHKPASTQRCGTQNPIYMRGAHPSFELITEMPLDGIVCFRINIVVCTLVAPVKIRKCNGQIQYYFHNFTWLYGAGFCFDPWFKNDSDCTTTTTTTTSVATSTHLTSTSTKLLASATPTTTSETIFSTTTSIQPTPVTTTFPTTTVTITPSTTTTTTSKTTTTENVGIIRVKTDLQFKTEGQPTNRQNITPYILFRCDFLKASGRIYTVSWFVDGVLCKKTGPSSNETDFLLHEDRLLTYLAGLNLHGKQLSCSVSIHSMFDVRNIVYTANSGNLKIAAEVMTNPVVLSKNGQTTINIKFTLPVGCGYSIINNEKPAFPCDYSFTLHMKNGWRCKAGGIANIVDHPSLNNFCTQPIKMLETSSQWNQTPFTHSMNITTIDYNYYDEETYYLKLKFDNSIAHKLWKNYSFPDIKVIISDTKIYQNKVCYCRVDPHMKTADNSYYEQQRTGYFMLYYNSKYKIEAQIQVEECNAWWSSRPKCACAIAVRAGKDVFMINTCGSVYFIGFTSCGDGGIINVRESRTREYRIFTPIGTQILVQMLSNFYSGKLNIQIFMAPKDERNVVGHCGKFDGDDINEFSHKTGDATNNLRYWAQDPANFSNSWRITNEENLFTRPARKLDSWNDINKKYCICQRPGSSLFETTCASSQYFGCMNDGSLTQAKCRTFSRQRRSSSKREETELSRLFSLFSEKRITRRKREVSYNISADEAASICGVLNQSLPLTELAEVSGNESAQAVTSHCEYDVVTLNDPTFVNVHLDAMNGVVKTLLALSPSYVSNNMEKVNYFIANSCSMNCSGNGICMANGTCDCKSPFRGSDCSIDITQPLTIDDIEGGGMCDIAEGDDCNCFTLRTNNLLENFLCAIDVYQVFNNTNVEKMWSGKNVGLYEDLFTGVCCVNNEQQIKRTSALAFKYGFALSNDGLNYGEAVMTYVYDSTCELINNTSQAELDISVKDRYCFIDGSCIESNQTSTADRCILCHPESNVFSWTRVCETNEADTPSGYNVSLVIATTSAVVIGILAVGLTVVLVWKFCLQQKVKPHSKPDEEPAGISTSSRQPVAYTAWSPLKYASKAFDQPEKNRFSIRPECQSPVHGDIFKGQKWTTITVSSSTLTGASETCIPKGEASKETTGFLKQNLKLEAEVAEGPKQKKELTRGVSVMNLEFEFDVDNE